jgi:hypothetical protein
LRMQCGRATANELHDVIRRNGELLDVVEIDRKRNVMASMCWTNEWLRDAQTPNREFLFLVEKSDDADVSSSRREDVSSTCRQLEAVRAELVLEQVEDVVEDFSGALAVELGEAVGDGPSVRPERVGCLLVERAGRSDPDALEGQ